jgi:hypothetical protein
MIPARLPRPASRDDESSDYRSQER